MEPVLGVLRVATPADLIRLGLVAMAGFCYSPVFRWERPYHAQYPADSLLSYRREFMNAVKDDHTIVLVAEDMYEPDENTKSKAVFPEDDVYEPPKAGAVVGSA